MIKVPENVQFVIDEIEKNGKEAYLVGGCVRDSLLGVNPKDWDICTNATPNLLLEIFKNNKLIKNGLDFGTLGVVIQGECVDVSTYRKEKDYLNGDKPEVIEFTENVKEDVRRRDFTINALLYNKKTGILDYVDGLKDIENKVIRAVGNAKERFDENYVRLLRAIKFQSRHSGFKIATKTQNAFVECKQNIEKISQIRRMSELQEILKGENKSKILVQYIDVILLCATCKKDIIPTKQQMKLLRFLEYRLSYISDDTWEITFLHILYIFDIVMQNEAEMYNFLTSCKISKAKSKYLCDVIYHLNTDKNLDFYDINYVWICIKASDLSSKSVEIFIKYKMLEAFVIESDIEELHLKLEDLRLMKIIKKSDLKIQTQKIGKINRKKFIPKKHIMDRIYSEILKGNLQNEENDIKNYIKKHF